MAKHLVTHENAGLTRREQRALRRTLAGVLTPDEDTAPQEAADLPASGLRAPAFGQYWALPVGRPAHRMTGYQLAAANPFSAADMYEPAGPVIGIERLSGGAAFTFDPWLLYLQALVTSPNLLVEGSLRQGKSFIIKRLIALLTAFGRYAINTSDSKSEHGSLALALGGAVFRMGQFGSPIRVNPLEAGEPRALRADDGSSRVETEQEWLARVRAARVSVLQQIAGLLTPGERAVTARETGILEWTLGEVVTDTGNRPTIRGVFEKLTSPDFGRAYGGYFRAEDAHDLIDGLRRLVTGDLAGIFDTHSSVRLDPESPYTVIDTSLIGQRGSGALAVTQAVTNAWVGATISNKGAQRQYFLIREEGWRDMKTAAALEAHQEQLKLSGEFGIAMVLIVHEDGDFDSVGAEGSKERELARSLLRGYANRICFNQPASVLRNAVAEGTYTEAEARAIATLSRGQFLVKLKHRSYVVDGTPTTTGWERRLFDTDRQMRATNTETEQTDMGTVAAAGSQG